MKILIVLITLTVVIIIAGCRFPAKSRPQAKQNIDTGLPKRNLYFMRLKPESVADYRKYHENVWPELVAAYKNAGITNVTCFLNGVDLVVYVEYADTVSPEALKRLAANEVEIKWQKLMAEL